MPSTGHWLAYGAALALTLCACAWITPRAWWRRPNTRALGVLAIGTAGGGALLLALFGADPGADPGPAAPPLLRTAQAQKTRAVDAPVAGANYRVRDALNLRIEGGVGAERLLVIPAGSRVTATGLRDGDWWQVRATLGNREVEGWASSLWLRRADEGR